MPGLGPSPSVKWELFWLRGKALHNSSPLQVRLCIPRALLAAGGSQRQDEVAVGAAAGANTKPQPARAGAKAAVRGSMGK